MGRRDCLTIFYFFYLVGSPKVGGAGDGKHKKKNTATLVINTTIDLDEFEDE